LYQDLRHQFQCIGKYVQTTALVLQIYYTNANTLIHVTEGEAAA